MNILNHKIGLVFSALIVSFATGCGTTAVQTAQAPTNHSAPVQTEAPADPSDPTSWVRFSVTPSADRPVHTAIATSVSRNTLCAGAVQPEGVTCIQAPLLNSSTNSFVASVR